MVLGCRVQPGGRLAGAARRRATCAAEAWHAGLASWIITSGGRRWHGIAEAEALRRELLRRGVLPDAVSRELCSLTTLENAWYTSRLLRARGLRRVRVVTCDWHMARALACFRAAGIDATGLPAPAPPTTPFRRTVRMLRERASLWLDLRASRRWAER